MMRQLACAISNEDFDDKSTTKLQTSATTQDTTFASSTNAPGIKTTKPWIWTSNTIDTGEYGQPTRHRRETEDTLSPLSTKSTGELIGKLLSTQASFTTSRKLSNELTTLQTLESTSQSNSPRENVEEEPITSDTTVASKTLPEDNGEYPETINQGQLFSIIENGTMFDIIELNETDDVKITKETTPTPAVYTTVMYHKEPTETPITVTKKELQPLNLTKEFVVYTPQLKGDSNVRLNRTFRKHVPLYEPKELPEIDLDIDNNLQEPENNKQAQTLHHTVEIKLQNVNNKNMSNTLFVTTKRIPKQTVQEIDPKMDLLNKNGTINSDSEQIHPTTLIEKMENLSSEEILRHRIEKDLNLDRIKQKKKVEKEKLQAKKIVKGLLNEKIENLTYANIKTTETPLADKISTTTQKTLTTPTINDLPLKKGAASVTVNEKSATTAEKTASSIEKIAPLTEKDLKENVTTQMEKATAITEHIAPLNEKVISLNEATKNPLMTSKVPIKVIEEPLSIKILETHMIDQKSQKFTTDKPSYDENFMLKPWENPLKDSKEDEKEMETISEVTEPQPETQPRPNRQRQLTRPQRRSFYPYFFSRVLG